MKISKGSKLLFIGDSVTDVGRNRPVAEGLFDPLGKGYVNIVSGFIASACPELDIRIVNMGCSGNTVRDLKNRWQADVLDLKPDWVSIMIGINDVWRQFDCPLMPEVHVRLDEYEKTLDQLVKDTLPKVKGMVIMAPYYIESNRKDAMRAEMEKYAAVCKKIAKKHKTLFVDVQSYFDKMLVHCHSSNISWDRVHPNIPGHTAIARAFLNAVEFPWGK